MTTGGWINLTLSVGAVLALFGWCLWRTLRAAPPPTSRTDARETESGDPG